MTTTDGAAAPSGAPTLATGSDLAAALHRAIGWFNHTRTAYPDAECLASVRDGDTRHDFYASDLHAILTGASGWAELMHAFRDGNGISDDARKAMSDVKEFLRRFEETVLKQKPLTPISKLDGSELRADQVKHLAYLLDFVDTVLRKHSENRQQIPPTNLDEFTDDMLDKLGIIESQLYRDIYDRRIQVTSRAQYAAELHMRAARVWPGLTPAQCGLATGILAARMISALHAQESRP